MVGAAVEATRPYQSTVRVPAVLDTRRSSLDAVAEGGRPVARAPKTNPRG